MDSSYFSNNKFKVASLNIIKGLFSLGSDEFATESETIFNASSYISKDSYAVAKLKTALV